MRDKIVIVFLVLCMGLQANVDIVSIKNINQINKGLSYLAEQEGKDIQTVKLKKYYLAQEVKKPSLFGSYDAIYTLYLAGFLQNAHPYWLKDDTFVFHTSSNKNYLKRLKKIYVKRYKIDLTLHENKNFRKDEFKLRNISFDNLKEEMNSRISLYFANKQQSTEKRTQQKTQKKTENIDKNLIVVPAKISTKSDIKNTQKGLLYLESQAKSETKTLRAKKYILAKKVEKPSFFARKEPIYNLYLTSILHKGKPAWLENGKFVFETSSNKSYLKRMQKMYKKRYNIEATIYRNPKYKKEPLVLQEINFDALSKYIVGQMPTIGIQEKRKEAEPKKIKRNIEIIIKKEHTDIPIKQVSNIEIKTKEDVQKIDKSIDILKSQSENQIEKIKLKKYFLAKIAKKPSFFSSMEPIYNLYMIAILNGGRPLWLADDRLVFHTSSNKNYLKRLQKIYKKRYNLEATIYKNETYRKSGLMLKKIDASDISEYLRGQIPETLIQKMRDDREKEIARKEKRAIRNRQNKIAKSQQIRREQKELKRQEAAKKLMIAKKKEDAEEKRENQKNKERLEKKRLKQKRLRTQRDTEEKRLAEEKRELKEERKRLEEERKHLEKQKRLLAEAKKSKEQARIASKEQEKKRLKKLELEASRAERKRKQEEEKALQIKKKKLEDIKKQAQIKKKKNDSIESDLDKMMKETSDFQKKLEKAESIKYY